MGTTTKIADGIKDQIAKTPPQKNPQTERDKITKAFTEQAQDAIVSKLRSDSNITMSKSTENDVKREIAKQARDTVAKIHSDYQIDVKTKEQEIKDKYESSPTPVSQSVIEQEINKMKKDKEEEFKNAVTRAYLAK